MANLGATIVAAKSAPAKAENTDFSLASVGRDLREIALGFVDLAQGVVDKLEGGLEIAEKALDPVAIRLLQDRPLTPMEQFFEDKLGGVFYLGEQKLREEKS